MVKACVNFSAKRELKPLFIRSDTLEIYLKTSIFVEMYNIFSFLFKYFTENAKIEKLNEVM